MSPDTWIFIAFAGGFCLGAGAVVAIARWGMNLVAAGWNNFWG